MLLRQMNFGVLSVWQLFYVFVFIIKGKLYFSLICSFAVASWKRVEPWKLPSQLVSEGKLLINRLLIKKAY